MDLGTALRRFRDERGLSLRELATLSEVDHAYIHRLEGGDKTAPSPEILDRLSRALKLPPARRKLLEFLNAARPMDPNLFEVALANPERLEIIKVAATMSFRGAKPSSMDEWRAKLDQIEELIST
jgi:transcriptional regulator with XRE-family HTH domain